MTRAPVRFARGVLLATLAAGPLFVLPLVVVLPSAPNGAAQAAPALLLMLPFSIVFGALISAIPNLLGATVLGALGAGNIGARLPVFWALAGAGAGALIEWAFTATQPDGGGPTLLLAGTGAGCALICRWGTRWAD